MREVRAPEVTPNPVLFWAAVVAVTGSETETPMRGRGGTARLES